MTHTGNSLCLECNTNSPNYCRVWFSPETAPLAERLNAHRYDGLCPDEVDGWDWRDPECKACLLLDRISFDLARPR